MGLLLLNGDAGFNVLQTLFSQNEQGLWLDPSDMNATKAGWRRNLGINTDALSGSSFAKTNANVNSSAEPAPTGYASVFVLSEDSATGVHSVGQASTTNTLVGKVANQWNTIHFACKAKERTRVAVGSNIAGEEVIFDLSIGSIVQQGAGVTGAILSLGSGWYRCSYSRLEPSTSGVRWECRLVSTGTTFSYAGDGSSGVYISGFQFEISPTPSEYQRITDFSTEFKAAYPTHTLYQDSNGVTPCTAAGDPVGLILDQSRGGLSQIGADLVTNGGFDSDTWWSKGAGVTIASGVCQYTAVALNAGVFRTLLLTAGKFYAVDFTVSGFSSGGVRVYSGGNRTGAFSTNGTYRVIVLAGSSDASLIFEATSAGTILALDNISVREIPGNHAYQTSSGARPTLARIPSSGRRNLLTRTEEFDNAAWTKQNGSVTQNATTAPDGTATADAFVASNGAATFKGFFQAETTAAPKTLSFYVKKGAANWVYLLGYNGTNNCWFDLQNVVVGTRGANYTNSTITSIGSGWFRLTATLNSGIAGNTNVGLYAADSDNSTTFTGDGSTISFYAWGAQLETGSSATNYQKVGSTFDVTESGVGDLWHLVFDGSDDSLVTNSVDFAGWTGTAARRNLLIDTEALGSGNWSQTNTLNGSWVAGVATVTNVEGYTYGLQTGTYNTAVDHAVSFDVTCNETVANVPIRLSGTVNVSTLVSLTAGVTTRVTMTGYRPFSTQFQLGLDLRDGVVPGGSNTTGYTLTFNRVQMEIGGAATDYQAPGTDEMTVIAGVRKLSDAVFQIVAELTTNWNTSPANNGSFYHGVADVPWLYAAGSRGTATAAAGQVAKTTSVTYAAPKTDVFTGLHDISSDSSILRLNGLEVDAVSVQDKGSGNFTNAAIYIGRRGGASFPYNGHLYQLIIRGKTTPTGKLLEAERFTAKKTGVTGI